MDRIVSFVLLKYCRFNLGVSYNRDGYTKIIIVLQVKDLHSIDSKFFEVVVGKDIVFTSPYVCGHESVIRYNELDL